MKTLKFQKSSFISKYLFSKRCMSFSFRSPHPGAYVHCPATTGDLFFLEDGAALPEGVTRRWGVLP